MLLTFKIRASSVQYGGQDKTGMGAIGKYFDYSVDK